MFKQKTKISIIGAFVVFGSVTLLSSCLKTDEYPDEPVIEFNEFAQLGDSGRVTFSFTDGDGDLGLDDGDNQAPFDTGSVYYNNVFITYYEKVNGVWEQGISPAGYPIEFKYRIERITPTGKNKALKGKIIVYIVPICYDMFSADNDTTKYSIKIVDRALHESNSIESGEIYR